MPWPRNERQALEAEHSELTAQLADYQRELAAAPEGHRERREVLTWQIRRVQNRLAMIETRLAAITPRATSE